MALFIGRLPPDCHPRELEDLFRKYGRITRCDVKRGGYGFVEYEDPRDAEDAIRALDGIRFLGDRIVVEWARGAKKSAPEECFKCGRTGHWARNCPLLGASGGGSLSSRDRYPTDRYARDRYNDHDRRDRPRSRSRSRGRDYDRERDRRSRSRSRSHSRSRSPSRGR